MECLDKKSPGIVLGRAHYRCCTIGSHLGDSNQCKKTSGLKN